MLTHLAREAYAGFDHERRTRITQTRSECLPLLPIEHDAEMGNRHVFAIDLVGMCRRIESLASRIDVRNQLMAKEIEVDPLVG